MLVPWLQRRLGKHIGDTFRFYKGRGLWLLPCLRGGKFLKSKKGIYMLDSPRNQNQSKKQNNQIVTIPSVLVPTVISEQIWTVCLSQIFILRPINCSEWGKMPLKKGCTFQGYGWVDCSLSGVWNHGEVIMASFSSAADSWLTSCGALYPAPPFSDYLLTCHLLH